MFARTTVVMASIALVLTGCAATEEEFLDPPVTVDSSGTFPEMAAAALTWLQQRPLDGGIYAPLPDETANEVYDRTVDTSFAFAIMGDEAGSSELTTGLIRAESLNKYAGDGEESLSIRNTARVIASVIASGSNPRELSGRYLVDELSAQLNAEGRFVDLGAEDTSDTLSQAWAVLALSAVDEAPRTAVKFLSAQQCKAGGYPRALVDNPDGDCNADVESTATTISALLSAGADASDNEVFRAVRWIELRATKGPSGDFWTNSKNEHPDVSITAIVTVALIDAHAYTGNPLRWLRSQVITNGVNAGAIEVDDVPDQRMTALAAMAFSGRGYTSFLF